MLPEWTCMRVGRLNMVAEDVSEKRRRRSLVKLYEGRLQMKSWTTVVAGALAVGLMSAPVSVYAESHEGGETEEAAAEGSEEAASSEEAAPEAASEGAAGACGGGGEASHEGSH